MSSIYIRRSESPGRWKRGGQSVCEWAYEGERKSVFFYLRTVGETERTLRYERSVCDSIRRADGISVKPSGTAGTLSPVPAVIF